MKLRHCIKLTTTRRHHVLINFNTHSQCCRTIADVNIQYVDLTNSSYMLLISANFSLLQKNFTRKKLEKNTHCVLPWIHEENLDGEGRIQKAENWIEVNRYRLLKKNSRTSVYKHSHSPVQYNPSLTQGSAQYFRITHIFAKTLQFKMSGYKHGWVACLGGVHMQAHVQAASGHTTGRRKCFVL